MGGVEQAAAQVGIPPEHVRKAARELVPRGSDSVPGVGGEWRQQKGPRWDRLVSEEVVAAEVPESAFPAMVGEIQRQLDLVGHASVIGGTLTWSPAAQTDTTRRIVISVTPRRGQTVIRVQESLEIQGIRKVIFPAGASVGVILGAGLGHALALGEPAVPFLVLAFGGMGIISALRIMTSIDAGDRGPQLQGLVRELAEIGAEALERRLGPG